MEEREHVCQICVSGVCQSTCRVTRILVYTVSRVCGIAKLLYAYRYSTCAAIVRAPLRTWTRSVMAIHGSASSWAAVENLETHMKVRRRGGAGRGVRTGSGMRKEEERRGVGGVCGRGCCCWCCDDAQAAVMLAGLFICCFTQDGCAPSRTCRIVST